MWKGGQSHQVGAPLGPAKGCYAHEILSLPATLYSIETARQKAYMQLHACSICVLHLALRFHARDAEYSMLRDGVSAFQCYCCKCWVYRGMYAESHCTALYCALDGFRLNPHEHPQ